MRLAIVINRHSGRKPAPWGEDHFRPALGPLGVDVSVHTTRGRGDAARIARELASSVDVIAVVGGDGTVHEVVNGMMPHPVPIAVIPSGAGNDLASVVDCARTPSDLAALLENGWAAELDVLDFGDRYCVNSAGLGFEGLVNRLSHDRAWMGGRLRYAIALIDALRSVDCPRFTIVTSRGDVITGEKLLISIGNGRRTGGAFYLTPDAFPDDGLIDVCVIEPMSRARILRLVPGALNGTHTRHREVRMLRVDSLSVEASAPYPMHIDGEYIDATPEPRRIAVVPAALKVMCRPSSRNRLIRGLKRVL
jgi:diacylglycerol kinase (ATP)